MQIGVDTSGLLKWSRLLDELAFETPATIARSLNAAGEDIVTDYANKVADDLGLDFGDVRSRIVVYQADAASPKWEMDASEVWLKGAGLETGRPWTSRVTEEEAFDQGVLLNIVTRLDCCDLCEKIASEGPYTPSKINKFAAEWANFVPQKPVRTSWDEPLRSNLLHPNCRCGTEPFYSNRRLNVTYGGESYDVAPRTLGRHFAEEMTKTIELVVREAAR